MLSYVFKIWILNFLLITIQCHDDHDHGHDLNNDLTIDLANIFKLYGNDTRSMSPEQLREFLNDFVLLESFANSTRYNCFQEKTLNFYNLTLSWRNSSIIDRRQFAKISAYLISYVNKCFGSRFNITEDYDQLKNPQDLTIWQKFKKNMPLISRESQLVFN